MYPYFRKNVGLQTSGNNTGGVRENVGLQTSGNNTGGVRENVGLSAAADPVKTPEVFDSREGKRTITVGSRKAGAWFMRCRRFSKRGNKHPVKTPELCLSGEEGIVYRYSGTTPGNPDSSGKTTSELSGFREDIGLPRFIGVR
jgi:hypothetical protein